MTGKARAVAAGIVAGLIFTIPPVHAKSQHCQAEQTWLERKGLDFHNLLVKRGLKGKQYSALRKPYQEMVKGYWKQLGKAPADRCKAIVAEFCTKSEQDYGAPC